MKSILIIEDNTGIRENIAEILELAGYRAFTAANGKLGVELSIRERPDLIICDIMMPALDGYGVLHLLRKNPQTATIPFIFLTARTERSDLRKGMEMGADDYITKPFEEIELLNAVEIRLKKADMLAKDYQKSPDGIVQFVKDIKDAGWQTQLSDRFEVETYSRKQLLFAEGKRPRHLFYLKEGKVKTFKSHPDGKEYITGLYAKGDFIGYGALINDENYDESAEVLEDVEVMQIPAKDFLEMIYGDLSVAVSFVRLMCRNERDKEERMMNLAYSSLRKRVAKGLLEIHDRFGVDSPIAISREDVAQYIGTATESLIRTLSDFKEEKLVEIKNGKILLINKEKIRNLVY